MKNTILITLLILAFVSCKKKEDSPPESKSTNNPTPTTPTCDSSIRFVLDFTNNFEETSCSNNNKDASGINTTFVNDRLGAATKAISFDGSSSYVEFPNDALLHPSFPFTVSFWVNPVDSSSQTNYFIQSQVANYYSGFLIKGYGDGQIAAIIGDTSGFTPSKAGISTVKFRSNIWTHITVVFNNINNFEMYFNGVPDNSITYSGSGASMIYAPLTLTSAKGRIGSWGVPDGSGGTAAVYFNGKMDNVKIWSRALSGTEVLSEYNSTN